MIETLLILITTLLVVIALTLINCARGIGTLIAEHEKTHSDLQNGFTEVINTLYKDPAERKRVNESYSKITDNNVFNNDVI